MASGTILRYKGEGNEQYKRPATDLIVTLVDEKSEQTLQNLPEAAKQTKRHGNNLIYTCKISLQQALNADPVVVETLDGRLLRVPVDSVITPRTVLKVDGEGMVIIDEVADPLDEPKRGDMYVKFDIRFPKKLTESQRQRLEKLL